MGFFFVVDFFWGEGGAVSENGRVPGGFPWCWARLEGHVAKYQISGPGQHASP